MKRAVIFLVLLLSMGLVSLTLFGCIQNSGYEIRPAPIDEVRVSIAKSNPPQMTVYIKGGLSDGCTTFHEIKTSRDANTVTISVTTRHPKDKFCPAIYTYFEKTVNLGSDFVRGQNYTLQVNDYITSFQYPL